MPRTRAAAGTWPTQLSFAASMTATLGPVDTADSDNKPAFHLVRAFAGATFCAECHAQWYAAAPCKLRRLLF